MDYTSAQFSFKLKKVLRYTRLYGPRRAWIKVKGQYHTKKRYTTLPPLPLVPPSGGHVGLIGCGNFAFSTIAYYLHRYHKGAMRGAMDIDIHRAASLYEQYGLRYYTEDADQILRDPDIDLIYIASNHASHAEYAIQAISAGKSVHIEKLHVVNRDQLIRLCQAMSNGKTQVNLGFNRPGSRIGQEIRHVLASETGPAMMNWFIAGHEIPPDHWYFREEEGGRVLGNLCHWTDFVYQMVDPGTRYPIQITPVRGQKSDCDIAVSFLFGDETIAVITFSSKGHTFEGVRERFAAHRGNALISMDDFQDLTIEVVDQKSRISHRFRDHGHKANILRSYDMAAGRSEFGCSVRYVWETGELFLKTREALETNQTVRVEPFSKKRLANGDA